MVNAWGLGYALPETDNDPARRFGVEVVFVSAGGSDTHHTNFSPDITGWQFLSDIYVANPFRYRGYYLDAETGMYYVSSRYYDPGMGRFLSPDTASVLTASLSALTDKNLYAYCDNNPVMRKDIGGQFWDTAIDVVSVMVSATDVIADPTSGIAWVSLAADIACALLPGITGGGAIVKAVTKGRSFLQA